MSQRWHIDVAQRASKVPDVKVRTEKLERCAAFFGPAAFHPPFSRHGNRLPIDSLLDLTGLHGES
ncbi:MAG: hypothetical protein WC740_16395 [Verrucomicrobiia bacterium]